MSVRCVFVVVFAICFLPYWKRLFFFSSRRRYTRSLCDWSSDVCSSDLNEKISIKNLDFYYGDNRALKNINVSLFQSKVTAFIGPSGCGKSTLLRVLNRMYDLYP